ncbi:hypothetical protein [Kocuria sabuli]
MRADDRQFYGVTGELPEDFAKNVSTWNDITALHLPLVIRDCPRFT